MGEARRKADPAGRFLVGNLCLALFLFAVLHFSLNSEVLGRTVLTLYGPGRPKFFGRSMVSVANFRRIFLYGKDFLYGYALAAALLLLLRDSFQSMKRALWIAIGGEVLSEFFFLLLERSLSFSFQNVTAQIAGSLLGFLILLCYERKLL